jgi:hypothetical protein
MKMMMMMMIWIQAKRIVKKKKDVRQTMLERGKIIFDFNKMTHETEFESFFYSNKKE